MEVSLEQAIQWGRTQSAGFAVSEDESWGALEGLRATGMGLTLAHEIELPHKWRNRQFRAGLPHEKQTTVCVISEAVCRVYDIVSGLIAKAIGFRATFM